MGYSYSVPNNFKNRLSQYAKQSGLGTEDLQALERCDFEYEDLGNAYYAGMKNTPWDSNALDVTLVGPAVCVSAIEKQRHIVETAISKALQLPESGLLLHSLFLLEDDSVPTAFCTNEERLSADCATARSVLADLVRIGEQISVNALYSSDTPEDSINDCLRNSLFLLGYNETRDQTRHGLSESQKSAGEVDLILARDGREIAIVECLKLSYIDSNSINNHVLKAVTNYNPLGTAVFIVSYVSSGNFGVFWSKYFNHLKQMDFKMQVTRQLQSEADPNAAMRIASATLSKDDYDFPIFFVAIKLCR